MKIKKILNNNVVISENENGVEQVISGRGIAFGKKVGMEIDESAVTQVFELKNQAQNQKFQEIITAIPLEYINLANEIIDMIKMELGEKISDSIYVTLTDHIYTAVERMKEGISMPNTMLWEIQHYYDTEYKIALQVLDLIEKKMNIRLSDDEAGFITLHIVNARTDGAELEETLEQTKIVQQIVKIVRYHFSIDFDSDSVYFYRFVTHLKFFAQRITRNMTYEDNDDSSLFDIVKVKYSAAYECSEKIVSMIEKNYKFRISNEEKMYLTIHIHRIINIGKN